jgi:predicted amidohydrolase YtcJ
MMLHTEDGATAPQRHRGTKVKRTLLAIVTVAAGATYTGAQNLKHDTAAADLVLAGGRVVTLAEPGLRARPLSIAVRGGRIAAVGTDAELRALSGPSTRRIDLQGALVLPGLTDAHVHVEGLGTARESLDLVGAATLDEALKRVAAAARTLGPGEWLLGRGWDQNDWPGQKFPGAADLDRVSGDHPVFLVRVDGHAAWANTRALQAAGLTAATADPDGGRILRDAAGAPTGILVDAAQRLVSSRIPAPSREVRKRRLRAGLAAAAEAGLTSVHDAGVTLDTIPLYKELLAEGAMAVRAYVLLRGPAEFLENAERLQPEIGLGDGRLTVRSIKVVADGALGSRGALLLAPYADEPSTRGLLTVDRDAFARLLEAAVRRGFQVATHAIGDAANRLVLDGYEKAFAGGGAGKHRFRIEHAQVLAPSDVPRFKALDVIPSMQPTHCTSDMYWAEARVGPQRAQGAYVWKTFLEQGVPIAAGSDAPVEQIAVLPGIHSAVTRQDAKGWPSGGWHPEQRVSLREALDMFASGAAYAAFEEADRGTIEVGKRADFTVLTRDITALPPAQILKTEVKMTIVGGQVAYQRK